MGWKGDPNALHTVVDGEIAGLTEKATPVDADLVVIEDSADSNSKKKAQLSNLPGGTSDHGGLSGLGDDDHTQYLLADGTRQADYIDVSGLTGATDASRYVGATTSGAPASGTFTVGDFVITQDGNVYVCTTAGSPGTWTQVGAAAATDSDAIHDNVAAEISAITEKASPASGDWLLIEDAADSNNKKKVDWDNLPSGGGGGDAPEWVNYLSARQADETGHANDQFWASGAPGSPAAGTAVAPTGTVTWLEGRNLLSVDVSGTTAGDSAARVYSLTPTSAPVTVEVAERLIGHDTSTAGAFAGVGFTDGTTDSSNHASASLRNFQDVPYACEMAGTWTANGSDVLTTVRIEGAVSDWLYLRCIWTASNTFAARFSLDGVTWSGLDLGTFAKTLTPTNIAVWATDNGETRALASFAYMRVYESDLS